MKKINTAKPLFTSNQYRLCCAFSLSAFNLAFLETDFYTILLIPNNYVHVIKLQYTILLHAFRYTPEIIINIKDGRFYSKIACEKLSFSKKVTPYKVVYSLQTQEKYKAKTPDKINQIKQEYRSFNHNMYVSCAIYFTFRNGIMVYRV